MIGGGVENFAQDTVVAGDYLALTPDAQICCANHGGGRA